MRRKVITDLEQLKTLKSESLDEVTLPNLIQKIPYAVNGHDPFADFWGEVWRILKSGGKVLVSAPYYTSAQSALFPRQVNELTFMQLNKEWRKANQFSSNLGCDFEVEKLDYTISQEFTGKAQETIQYHAAHSWNVVTAISAILLKK